MRQATTLRLRFLLRVVDERLGARELPLLSVSQYLGVVPRSDITDDAPRAEEPSNYKVCRPGDIVVNRMSAYQGALGRTEFTGIVSPDYIVLRALKDVDSRWLHHLMRSAWFVSKMAARIRGIGSIGTGNVRTPRVSAEEIGDIRVDVPILREQRAIADFLDAETARIDALTAKKRRMIEMLTARFLESVRLAVTREINFGDPLQVRPEEVPPTWLPARVSWRFNLGSGTTPTAGDPAYYGPGTPWVVTGDLEDARIMSVERSVTAQALQDYSALAVHPSGSLVVAMYGATIGKMAILGMSAAVNQACCVLTPRFEDRPEFVFYWLLAHRSELIDRGRGAGQPNISQELIGRLRIALPPPSVQDEVLLQIERIRAETEALADRLARQVVLLEEHRQALITTAVTGELEVPGVAA